MIRLFGDKPLPEPMLSYCQFDPLDRNLAKFEVINSQMVFPWWWISNRVCVMHLMTAFCLWCVRFSHMTVTGTVNPILSSRTIWRHRSESTEVQVMACCLTTPSHYWNRCGLITKLFRDMIHYKVFANYIFENIATSSLRDQSVTYTFTRNLLSSNLSHSNRAAYHCRRTFKAG